MTDDTPINSIRELFGEDVLTQARSIADYAFGASPGTPNSEEGANLLKYNSESRFFVSFSGEQPQATATVHKMVENVRGKVLPMAGVGAVASLPAGRRQGHVRNLFIRLFAEMKADGFAVSTLYPFRESFYERFGYATFQRPRFVTFNPANLAPLMRIAKPGHVEQRPMSEAWEAWRGYLEQIIETTHGFSLRDRVRDIRNKDTNSAWVALAYNEANEIVGAMTFRITGYTKRLEVGGFYSSTVAGKYLLLDWIGRHVDQVSEASIKVAPNEFADLWVRDLNAQSSTTADAAWPGPSARIIDVQGLNGIGAGAGDRSIAIQLIDDYADWNNGVFTLSGQDGVLAVTPGGEPVATVTIQGLAALIWAGQDPADFIYRGWGDVDDTAAATLRALFPVAYPVLHEEF